VCGCWCGQGLFCEASVSNSRMDLSNAPSTAAVAGAFCSEVHLGEPCLWPPWPANKPFHPTDSRSAAYRWPQGVWSSGYLGRVGAAYFLVVGSNLALTAIDRPLKFPSLQLRIKIRYLESF